MIPPTLAFAGFTMPPTNHLKKAFPRDWAEIQKTRKTDRPLDEICTDFETLSFDLEKAANEPGTMSKELKADVLKSISALINEISHCQSLEKK
ncbi:hypothetical protein C1J03_05310 [Sulfitobacter sp. SK012]|uniref:hypothetical protein n=1 Tax=Sulfitobacter sp. SK012 TaxID=1389005 RepID=UPI000E0BCA0B|nr:hypothetical protein [Sulfitobacter sp. SK012]AXI45506.1 hypothetical protein C1J03_05310 [Sulfitobacter sp. SK012]